MTKVLGVKEAMQHFVSTLDGVETPATTIKKLTKQALDPNSENEYIQKARTIAEIWEEAAIGHGYVPDRGESGDISFNPPGGTVVSDPTNPITPGKPV